MPAKSHLLQSALSHRLNWGWRADFVIHRYDWICGKWRTVIAECDGHDFHERTKEQAARDRSRDRRASLSGFVVLRFTGSELWKDPLGCAEQVMAWFTAESVRDKPLEASVVQDPVAATYSSRNLIPR